MSRYNSWNNFIREIRYYISSSTSRFSRENDLPRIEYQICLRAHTHTHTHRTHARRKSIACTLLRASSCILSRTLGGSKDRLTAARDPTRRLSRRARAFVVVALNVIIYLRGGKIIARSDETGSFQVRAKVWLERRDERDHRLIPSRIVITSTTNRIINNNGNGNKRLSYDPLPYVYMLLPL